MQGDMNHAIFTGRLTKDPELRASRSGRPVTTLRIAIQRSSAADGSDRGAAFYSVEVWNGLAETCARYLTKGRRVAVEGYLEHRDGDPDGERRERSYVVGRDVRFLDAPPRQAEQNEPEAASA